ncbi:hypothetical protein ACFE04_022059 [Oxalis oulophora]
MVKKKKLHQNSSSILVGSKLSVIEQQVMEEDLDPKECVVQFVRRSEVQCDHKKVARVPKSNAEKKVVDSVVDSELDLELVETREEVCLEIEEILNNNVDSLIVTEEESVVKMVDNCLISNVPSSSVGTPVAQLSHVNLLKQDQSEWSLVGKGNIHVVIRGYVLGK